jgi:NAD(P)-dependent dehydrogenase (short-subunit alcohol dehydrogenase family)
MTTSPIAIVTGASRGFGLALTRSLSQHDWRVVVDARDGVALERAVGRLPGVSWVAGDICDGSHRIALVEAAGDGIDLLVNNAGTLGPSPRPALADYPLAELASVFEVNVLAQLALVQLALPRLAPRAAVVNITSDASREPYAGWGGYGAAKAALDQLSAILGAEQPELRIYSFDPGDMRTVMHQQAFPGEDISDRPLPEESVPPLLELISGELPSGRYTAAGLAVSV